MEPGRRYFSYQKAVEMLPQIIELRKAATSAKGDRQKAESDLAAYKQRLVMAGGAFPNNNRLAAYADLAKTSQEALKSAVDSILNQGVEVRDLEQGLIDFPALRHGEPVYLCYQLGEETIQFWHAETAGFAGRKPITPDFIAELEMGHS